ncbi:MAG: copper resistance CopC family protein [Actinomycetota bacterium]
MDLVALDLRRVTGVLSAALVLLVAAAAPALAAPQRLSSDPEPGAELHEPPSEVTISFSEPLDESSEIRVFDECERRLDDRDTQVSVNELTVGIELQPTGTYTVAYEAVGLTGTAEDAYTFTVLHGGTSCDGSGGGHGGHDGHGDGGDDGGGSGDHEGHGGDSGRHGGGDGDHDGTGHDAHATDAHATEGHPAGDHAVMGHREMRAHGDHGHRNHANHNKHGEHQNNSNPGNPPQALGGGPPITQPGAAAVLAALALATLFGVAGGWVLRVSNPR